MTRRHIIIVSGIALAVLWVGLVYLVLQMPKSGSGPIALSPTPHYVNTSKFPPTPIIGMKNGTIRVTTRPAQRPTHVTLPPETSSSMTASPFTYLGSSITMKSIGSSIISGNNQGTINGTSSQRGTAYTSSSHSWGGFVSPVAAQDIAYVPAGSGELPDNGFKGRIRLAPPTEDDSGTNGPNIDVEQPIGEGLWLLLCAAITYMIFIFYTKNTRK